MPAARPDPAPARPASPPRLESIDLVRGVAMVLMALDHTRDFFHFGAIHGHSPEDLATTTAPLFLTRWITHFCAPTFCFLAGTGAFLAGSRGKAKPDLARFLLTRGLWLLVVEFTYFNWAHTSFSLDPHHLNATVLWSLGWSMIVLAGLVRLPLAAIAAFGLATMAGHDLADGLGPASWGSLSWLWKILHAGGDWQYAPGYHLRLVYPLIPWIGVMAAGYAFGALMVREPAQRRRRLLALGSVLTLAFLLLRFSNLYGDPHPWTTQNRPLFTLLSFLNCEKYPPSLCYLLMTLGPAILVAAWFDRGVPAPLRPLLVFGRVPMFYYLLQIAGIHALAILIFRLRDGQAAWLHGPNNVPVPPPATSGFGLVPVYIIWLAVVVALYPVCRRFAELKRRRRDARLSYF